jgi:hypothetical protein
VLRRRTPCPVATTVSPILFYYCLWIVLGLVLAGLASTLLVRQLRRRVQHEVQARALLDALSRYAVWTAAQRHGNGRGHERATAAAALREARLLQARCFPALTPAFSRLLDSDRRLQSYLREQQSLRVHAPEAWLDSQPAPVLDELWQQHEAVLHALARRLGV